MKTENSNLKVSSEFHFKTPLSMVILYTVFGHIVGTFLTDFKIKMHIPYSPLSKQTIISFNFQNSKGTKLNAVFFFIFYTVLQIWLI